MSRRVTPSASLCLTFGAKLRVIGACDILPVFKEQSGDFFRIGNEFQWTENQAPGNTAVSREGRSLQTDESETLGAVA